MARTATTLDTGGVAIGTVFPPYPQFQWIHYIMRYDLSTKSTFRNGQPEISIASSGAVTPPVGNMAIGNGNGLLRYWPGPVCEVQYWDRAISDTECADVYAGVNNSGIRTALSSEWLLASNGNDTTGTNNGTLVGSPTFTSTDVPFSLRVAATGRVAASNRTVIT